MTKIFNKSYFLLLFGAGYLVGIPIAVSFVYFLIWPFKYHPAPFWVIAAFIIPFYMILTYVVFTSMTAWWLIYDEEERRVILKKVVKVVADFKIDEIDKGMVFYTAPSKVFRGGRSGGINLFLKNGKKIDKGVLDIKIVDFLLEKFKENKVNFVVVRIISNRDRKVRVIDPYTGFSKVVEGDVFKLTSIENVPNLIEFIHKAQSSENLKIEGGDR